MDRGAERLDSYRVSAGLCAGTEPGGISVGLLEAARTTQRLCQRLLGVGRSSETDVETHPSSPAHPDGMLATILPTAWAHYIMRTSIMKHWSDETLADVEQWPDRGLVREGLRLFEELPHNAPTEVLLATDL